MFNRRKFLHSTSVGLTGLLSGKLSWAQTGIHGYSYPVVKDNPVVISTWDDGIAANRAAWEILNKNGKALDAVEAGVRVTEAAPNCCVGLGANPDRDGYVTLDACIMDERGNCGSVGFIERIKHPISVARRVMEKTPHVMLVGIGAQQFAVSEGFPLEEQRLSDSAKKSYKEWLKKSEYKPVINVENTPGGHGPSAPAFVPAIAPDSPAPAFVLTADGASTKAPGDGASKYNHDTIGMVAMDASGNLSGSCTTSGMGFKMRGRLGDSPIIGAGLFVDNEVGAATATGQGEDVIRICGTHTVVELMRQGLPPFEACKAAVERIIRIKGEGAKEIQVGFLALNKKGEVGAYALQKGFSYAVRNNKEEKLYQAKSHFV
ncbi:MAG TPA: N(4)-(beta-N-acetylglucosaminyl)-L-asparaginase [Puia sp.]|nr:N(4)-(beta-N-acetylglucosaminyl)-L-asparaginase [Puia sp.]